MKKESLIAVIIAIAVLLFNNSPLIWGAFSSSPSFVFLGRRVVNSQDMYTYLSFIEQGKQGRILFENLYDPETKIPSLFRPSYLLIGKFAQATNISSLAAYQIFRIIFSIIFFIVLYHFISLFFDNSKERLLTYAIVLLSSGLGFLTHKILSDTADLWIPESITFFSLSEAPHFILSQILMVSGFAYLLKFLKENKLKFVFYSSISFLILSFEHPFNIFVILFCLGIFYFFETTKLKIGHVLVISFFSLIGLAYQFFQIKLGILSSWYSQNVLNSPDSINFLSGFGLLLPLAIVGIEKTLKEESSKFRFLIYWLMATFLLIYFPLAFQRRFIEGVHIPLTIFASCGLFHLTTIMLEHYKINQKGTEKIICLLVIIILSLTNVFIIKSDFNEIAKDNPQNYYYHLSKEELEALDWLKVETNYQDVILANWFYGNLIPGIIGRKVYLGHKIQTPDFDNKARSVDAYLLSKNTLEDEKFLKNGHIAYIFLGKNDSMLQYGFKPDQKNFLKKIYSKNGVEIYKVLLNFPQ